MIAAQGIHIYRVPRCNSPTYPEAIGGYPTMRSRNHRDTPTSGSGLHCPSCECESYLQHHRIWSWRVWIVTSVPPQHQSQSGIGIGWCKPASDLCRWCANGSASGDRQRGRISESRYVPLLGSCRFRLVLPWHQAARISSIVSKSTRNSADGRGSAQPTSGFHVNIHGAVPYTRTCPPLAPLRPISCPRRVSGAGSGSRR